MRCIQAPQGASVLLLALAFGSTWSPRPCHSETVDLRLRTMGCIVACHGLRAQRRSVLASYHLLITTCIYTCASTCMSSQLKTISLYIVCSGLCPGLFSSMAMPSRSTGKAEGGRSLRDVPHASTTERTDRPVHQLGVLATAQPLAILARMEHRPVRVGTPLQLVQHALHVRRRLLRPGCEGARKTGSSVPWSLAAAVSAWAQAARLKHQSHD